MNFLSWRDALLGQRAPLLSRQARLLKAGHRLAGDFIYRGAVRSEINRTASVHVRCGRDVLSERARGTILLRWVLVLLTDGGGRIMRNGIEREERAAGSG